MSLINRLISFGILSGISFFLFCALQGEAGSPSGEKKITNEFMLVLRETEDRKMLLLSEILLWFEKCLSGSRNVSLVRENSLWSEIPLWFEKCFLLPWKPVFNPQEDISASAILPGGPSQKKEVQRKKNSVTIFRITSYNDE